MPTAGCVVDADLGDGGAVWAHHSFAGYDMTKTLTAEATLKEFRWAHRIPRRYS